MGRKMRCVGVALGVLASAAAQQIEWKQNPANGHWYGATYTTTTWTAGEALAVSLGGHLATIRSAAEQAWIQANMGAYLFGSGLWIGFNDAAVEGTFVWVSGEPVTYTNWNTGEPNNGGGIEDWAMLIGPGAAAWKWNDGPDNSVNTRPLIELASRPSDAWSWPTFTGTNTTPLFGCIADIDGDEDLDYLSPNYASQNITVYANNGSGSFSLVQTITGCGAVFTLQAADMNGDGRVDVVATDQNGRLLVMYGGAGGTLGAPQQIAAIPGAHGLQVADLNGDGRLDCVVTSYLSDDRVRIVLAQASGLYTIANTYGPYVGDLDQPTLADFDGDQVLDMVVAGQAGVVVLRGLGGGAFSYMSTLTTARCIRAAAVDLDGDGDREVVVPLVDLQAVQVWRNDGAMTFTLSQSLVTGNGPHWASSADLDGDGDQDVVVPCYSGDTIQILRNDAGTLVPTFTLAGQDYALWIGCADLDGDSKPDLICSNHDGNNFSVHRNQSLFGAAGSAPATWTASAAAPPFAARHSAAIASLPTSLLLFGGYAATPQNETWSFDGTTWTKLYALANPAVRYDHTMVHDPVRNETVLFGGRNLVFPAMPDTWVWDGFDWIRRFPAHAPSARFGHRMVFNAALGQVVLFGGRDANTVFDDLWTWNGVDWTQVNLAGPRPAARSDTAMVYDSYRDRIVLFGGEGGSGPLGDLWELGLAGWSQVQGATGGPGALADAAAVYDASQRRVVVQGGRTPAGASSAMFAFDGQGWVRFANVAGGPAPRSGHCLAQIGGDAKVWLYGGSAAAPLYAGLWQTTLPQFGRFDAFGAGCLGSGGVPALRTVAPPVLGRDFVVAIDNPPVGFAIGGGILGYSNTSIGVLPLPAEMTFLGMPGCFLRVDPQTLWPFLHTGGEVRWSYSVPYSLPLIGAHFYVQVLLFDPNMPNPANTFGAVMSNGFAGVVGY